MSNNKKNSAIIAAVIVAVLIVLWLLGRGSIGAQNVVRQAAPIKPSDFAFPNAPQFNGVNLPPLSYTAGSVTSIGGSKGCLLCYSGYQRLETPAPAPSYSPPSVADINQYIYINSAPAYNRPQVIGYN